jgi:hypothetical protein
MSDITFCVLPRYLNYGITVSDRPKNIIVRGARTEASIAEALVYACGSTLRLLLSHLDSSPTPHFPQYGVSARRARKPQL